MIQQIKYFIAVVDAHSFTKAAADCHISQSAISQQIKELENNLGTPLLTRVGRSFELTPAGTYFYSHGPAVLQAVQQLQQGTIQAANLEAAVLHVGYIQNFGSAQFLQAVAEFSQRYPQVKLKISNGTHEQLYDLLRTDQIDVIFSDQRRALSENYNNEPLITTHLSVAVAKQALPEITETVTLKTLADLPCILVVSPQQQANEMTYYREILGVTSEFRIVGSNDEAEMLVASNQGFWLRNDQNQNKIDQSVSRILRLVQHKRPVVQHYYAFWKQDNSGYYIESFALILKAQFEKLIPAQ